VQKFQYTVSRTRKLTTGLSLSIHPEKGVRVRAPFWVPDLVIRKFVEEKRAWIEKHLSKIKPTPTTATTYLEGEKHLYFGQEYSLNIISSDALRRTEAQIAGENISVSVYSGHAEEKRHDEIKEAILRFYLEVGIGVITEKVNLYSSQLGVEYSQIDIKKVSSIWGSCSPTNRLCFNRKLVMAPHEVVDYVVIHEVCHMVHRNHSSRFWGLVAKFDPKYKEHRRWLHRNHLLLTL